MHQERRSRAEFGLVILAYSANPYEMVPYVAFHKGLHFLPSTCLNEKGKNCTSLFNLFLSKLCMIHVACD